MQVRVIPFGVLKDWLGTSPATVELREGASVAELLAGLGARVPAPPLRGIAVSVNAEYATAEQVLREGDEVGLLPPVSGGTTPAAGASRTADSSVERADEPIIEPIIALTRERIDAEKLVAATKHGEDGAVVVFDGIVRNNTRGRHTLYLVYEAYEEMALKQMHALAQEVGQRFAIRDVALVHRLGKLEVGETSVLIAVASAHRAAAFDACRWLIDTLKKTVPIWKKEHFEDGAVWADGEPFPAEVKGSPVP
jgi:MoaE-MoaD fusion protein